MIIRIKNLKCETIIGVYAPEREQKQTLIINLKIEFDEGQAAITDNIEDTLNYHLIVEKVRVFVEANNFNLLEKMVENLGAVILSSDKVLSCEVEVDKPDAPIEGIDSVSVSKYFKKK